MFGFNEASLPVNTKFNLQELKWNTKGKSQSKAKDISGVFEKIGPIFVSDATISESYQSQSDSPLYAVEGGIPINDAGNIRQKTITITALNSNSNMSIVENITNPLQALSSSLLGQQASKYETKVEQCYRTLSEWHEKGTPLFLKTAYEKAGYKDHNGDLAPFKIINFAINRTADTGDAIGYTITLVQVYIARIAKSTTGDVLIKFKGEKASVSLGRNEEFLPDAAGNDGRELSDLSKQDVQGGKANLENYIDQVSKTPVGP